MSTIDEIRRLADENDDYIVQTRRCIHRHPELSLKEFETAKRIRSELDQMGISWRAIGDTGTVGTLPATEPGGCTVALRADIDALPMPEETGLPFASEQEGVMHACGHDSHTAMLLGAAKILTSLEQRPNTVVFDFQPAEEICQGSRLMMAGGVLDGVDAIYGSHVWPGIEAGKIVMQSGSLMAGADQFDIVVHGRGGHGSAPETCNDPIPACTAIVDAIHQVKSLSLRGDVPLVLTVGYIRCGTAANIIPETGVVGGTARWFSREAEKIAHDRIQKIVDSACAMYDCTAEIQYREFCACTTNDADCAAQAQKALVSLYGEEALLSGIPLALGSEDFSYYTEKVPAAFALIGVGRGAGSYGVHNTHFNPDESAFHRGAALYAAFACEYKK